MTLSAATTTRLQLAADALARGDADGDTQRLAARVMRAAIEEDSNPADRIGMTPVQRKALIFICEYCRREGVSPTYTEIAAALGLASKSGIHRVIVGLRERGWIVMTPSLNRSIRVLVAPDGLPMEASHDAA